MIVAIALWVGCAERCAEPPLEGLEGAFDLEEMVPPEAEWVVYGESLRSVVGMIRGVDAAVASVGIEGPDVEELRAAGAWLEGPAVLFGTEGGVVLVAYVDREADADEEALLAAGVMEALELERRRTRGVRGVDGAGRWWTAATDGRVLMVGWPLPGTEGTPELKPLWHLGEAHRVSSDRQRAVFQSLVEEAPGAVVGVASPGPLVRRWPGEGRAAGLREHLADQIGEVYLGVVVEGEKIEVDVVTPGDREVVVAVPDLGEARDVLPDLGGLVRPGVLGVVRVSADPHRLAELLRSALSVEERQALDQTLASLREELTVDLESEVIDNFTGQAAVVFFGFEDPFFEAQGAELLGEMLRLRGTREAVLLPFRERERLEELLNVFTQMSRGRLRRQVTGHTVQYAWFEEASLEWALILSDTHLLFLDSSIAFDHASAWERNPRALGETLESRGVGEMLSRERGVGFYLDLGTIRPLLRDGEREQVSVWLQGLEAVTVETDVEGRTDRTRVKIWLDEGAGR